MKDFDQECIQVFLKKQLQLVNQIIAENEVEAEEFLEDAMAVVCEDIEETRNYMEESGMDVDDMSDDEIKDAAEVFELPSGRFLVVQG